MNTVPSRPAPAADGDPPLVARLADELRLTLIGRAVLQSFRPVHLLLGSLAALVVFGGGWMLHRLWAAVFDSDETPFGVLGVFWPTGGAQVFESRLAQFERIAASQRVGAAFVIAITILVTAPFLGAIARSAASSLCAVYPIGPGASLGHARRRLLALVGAPGIPLVLVGLVLGLISLFGLALFSAGFTRPIGGVLFVVPLLLGVAGALIGGVFVASHGMLAPATAIDDADAVDAIQRSAGYVLSRPIRFVLYAIVFSLLLSYAYAFVQTVCRVAIGAASNAVADANTDEPNADFTLAAVAFWVQMLWLVFIGWVISFYATASTALYLIMREACDGQDVSVIAADQSRSLG